MNKTEEQHVEADVERVYTLLDKLAAIGRERRREQQAVSTAVVEGSDG